MSLDVPAGAVRATQKFGDRLSIRLIGRDLVSMGGRRVPYHDTTKMRSTSEEGRQGWSQLFYSSIMAWIRRGGATRETNKDTDIFVNRFCLCPPFPIVIIELVPVYVAVLLGREII